jgi:isopentenyl diphosphate isomerase/L-lactate dehydrogenase-like FMN-dependent dehydrogenase
MLPLNVREYEGLAESRLDHKAWDYMSGGSDDEVTLHANRAAFAHIQLRPRVLVDVSHCDLSTTVLGTPVSIPILVAPMGYQCLATPEGECATARAAGTAEALMVVSTMATRTLEETAAVATGPLWFQLYVYKDRSISEQLVRRAEAAGYRALVLTVDLPRIGRRERDIRNGFGLPPHLHAANFVTHGSHEMPETEPGTSGLAAHTAAHFDESLTWEAVAWLKGITRLPVLLKGILTAEDAALAVQHGADGLIVSNHGGRQLDTVPASIEALPAVAEAVAGRMEVYVDGGIRRGTDVLKALALGARAVLVGRPVLWGLAVAGEAGARDVLELLRAELELALALAGRPTLASIDRSVVSEAR